MSTLASSRKRFAYMDFLRILAVFFVIVNHTNSLVFQKLAPGNFTWWLSIIWYYTSKIAVPLFVMVSGACLLTRQDSYARAMGRFLRTLAVLVLFSYVYYLIDVWHTYWTWQKALDIPGFLASIWQGRITDSFWYLYFYLGMMLMLPLLQRLASAMKKQDMRYMLGLSFGVYALWPLLTHYWPALALPAYFDLPLFAVFIGLFFAGHYVHTYAAKASRFLCTLVMIASVAASTWLTRIEVDRVGIDAKYWFMDDRMMPSIFVILCSFAVMLLSKRVFETRKALSPRAERTWATLGACSFGIYLLQDLVIAESRYRFFVPASGAINPLLAAFIWEAGVFLICLAIAWVLKKTPLLGKLL